ncbi:MAG: glycosyltransferase family 39 protein [Acidobacteria bacterium]|nr:glycosyltransferase family 39 protein [Acidobacteriota bacterium]MCA1627889.1 glycosyltransferase family 39 protein [Acidobacteriota bacterium]
MLNRNRLLLLLGALLLTFCIRGLTLQFMRAHLNDPGWFQVGSYAKFDRQARDILDGRQRLFWIDDPARTDLAQYPPAFPAAVALIYKLGGDRSAYAVQSVQWIADLCVLFVLVTGIAATAFGPRAGIAASYLFAFSALFAMYGAYPSADAPATWFVLGGAWVLLLAAKRNSVWLALAAGVLLGIACWFRVNPLYLCVGWAIALLLFTRGAWRRRLQMSAAALLGTVVVIAPIVVRNYLVFPDFTPTGGTIGANLWEGLGETELGRQHGFLYGDDKLIEHERVKMGLPPGAQIDAQWPDGIRRDRERTREALAFIKQHPIWYAGVMLGRMWGMLKVAGDPVPYTGISGINVTSQKCLPPERQGGVLAFAVNAFGSIQSVVRYLFLPLAAVGMLLALRRDWRISCILLVTILYYLIPGTAAHTEIRYVLPMHGLLTVFGGCVVKR